MSTEISKPSTQVVPSAYDSARNAVRSGLHLGFVRTLVNASKPPAVRLVMKAFGAGAGKKAAVWLDTDKGHAMFSVAVGGLGLGDGIAMGASSFAKEVFGELLDAFKAVSVQIDALEQSAPSASSTETGS